MHRLHVMNLLANAIFAVSICWTALAVRHVHFLPLMVFVCNVNGVCGWQQAAWTALHTVPQWWRIGNSRSSCSNMYAPIKNAFKGNHYFIARAKATQFWKISLTTWIWLRCFFFLLSIWWMNGWMDGSCRAKIDQPNNGGMNETKTVFFSPNAISSTIISIDSSQCRIMSGAYMRACQRPDTYSGWFGGRVVGSKLSFFPHIFLMNCSRNMENWVDIAVVGTHCGHVFREFVSHV